MSVINPRIASRLLAGGLLLATLAQAQDDCDAEESCAAEEDRPRVASLGGPEQVDNRLHIDSNQVTALRTGEFAPGYFRWKDEIKEQHGLNFAGDYSTVYLHSSDSPGEDDAFSGMFRLFGSWELTNDGQGNSGALIFKGEHRHAYGNNIPADALGFEIGYPGLLISAFSDQEWRLTNLYWRQRMKGGNLVFVGGYVDVTDYVDVYTLASPWTGFFNFAFSTGAASIATPNEGLGFALGGYFNENWYAIGGFADTNSDPADPWDTFESFFDEREYFKHLEIGYNSSRETAFLNNVHVTLWHADEREAAATPDGWGVNFSWSQYWDDRWTTFVRGGIAEDGGSLLEETLSTGFAYQTVSGGNQLGVGFNWGKPNESTWGPGLDDQKTLEVFYRIQLFKELAITPDIQYIKDPALNPQDDDLWIFGLRARLAL